MEDSKIVELYWERNEDAINQTSIKYGKYCSKIAFNILFNEEDSKECVNDTYLGTWKSIPTNRPEKLSTYVGKICRNLALNMYEKMTAAKRGGCQTEVCIDELNEISGDFEPDKEVVLSELTESINQFLSDISTDARKIFVKRYWYMENVKDIAKELEVSESKVKMTLLRTRDKLKAHLLKEGYGL